MKASEMANEELAECIESARLAPAKYVREDGLNFHREAIREAAARLRKFDITIVAQKAKGVAEGYAHGCEEVADLRRRLRVAEKCLVRLKAIYYRTGHSFGRSICDEALAVIREAGGAK